MTTSHVFWATIVIALSLVIVTIIGQPWLFLHAAAVGTGIMAAMALFALIQGLRRK